MDQTLINWLLGGLVLRRELVRGSGNKAAMLTCRSQAGSGYMGDKPRRCRSDLRPKPTHRPHPQSSVGAGAVEAGQAQVRLHLDSFGRPAMVARELAAMLPPMPVDQQYIDDRARDSQRALEMAALAFVPTKQAERLCPLKCS